MFLASVSIATLECCSIGLPQLFATKVTIVLKDTPAYGILQHSTQSVIPPLAAVVLVSTACPTLVNLALMELLGMTKTPQISTGLRFGSCSSINAFQFVMSLASSQSPDTVVLTRLSILLLIFLRRGFAKLLTPPCQLL